MANGPGMRCVLEYLEANKRIHITARSPVLRNFEKLVPLHLDQLSFRDDTIQLNNVSYGIKLADEKIDWDEQKFKSELKEDDLMPGDFIVTPADGTRYRKYTTIEFLNATTKATTTLRLPDGYETHFSAKILANQLLRYKDIYANKMSFEMEDSQILRLPANFQVHVCHLNTQDHEFSDFGVLLHPDCVPLKSLTATINSAENYEHLLFKSAEKVVILDMERVTQEILQNLTNKHVVLDNNNVERENLVRLIKFWIENKKPVGTIFESMTLPREKQALEAFKSEFNGTVTQWSGSEGRYVGITIPMSETAELFIISPKGNATKTSNWEMRVLAKGATKPHVQKRKRKGE